MQLIIESLEQNYKSSVHDMVLEESFADLFKYGCDDCITLVNEFIDTGESNLFYPVLEKLEPYYYNNLQIFESGMLLEWFGADAIRKKEEKERMRKEAHERAKAQAAATRNNPPTQQPKSYGTHITRQLMNPQQNNNANNNVQPTQRKSLLTKVRDIAKNMRTKMNNDQYIINKYRLRRPGLFGKRSGTKFDEISQQHKINPTAESLKKLKSAGRAYGKDIRRGTLRTGFNLTSKILGGR